MSLTSSYSLRYHLLFVQSTIAYGSWKNVLFRLLYQNVSINAYVLLLQNWIWNESKEEKTILCAFYTFIFISLSFSLSVKPWHRQSAHIFSPHFYIKNTKTIQWEMLHGTFIYIQCLTMLYVFLSTLMLWLLAISSIHVFCCVVIIMGIVCLLRNVRNLKF